MSLLLNLAQERELHRLIDYERSLGDANADPMFRCAFPYRPDNDLQAELIDLDALSVKSDPRHGAIVVISSAGYSHFPERAYEEQERLARSRRDSRLIGLTALFSVLSVVAGFLLGLLAR